MELGREHGVGPDGRDDVATVDGARHDQLLGDTREHERVAEVVRGHRRRAAEQLLGLRLHRDGIPAHVGNADVRVDRHGHDVPRYPAEPRVVAELVQPLGKELQAEADTEHRRAPASDMVVEGVGPTALAEPRGSGARGAHAREDHALGIGEVFRPGRDLRLAARPPHGAPDRRQVAGTVVDDADHGVRLPASTACRQISKSHGGLFGRARHVAQSGI